MTPRQWIILGIAGCAGLGAFVLLRSGDGEGATANTAPAPPPSVKVLVAARDLPLGAVSAPEDLRWAEWPQGAAAEAFIEQDEEPEALETFAGRVARVAIRAGEPIFPERLIEHGDRGVFAAIVAQGSRAVALEVSPATATAGFIQPGDFVDVILTRSLRQPGADAEVVRSGVVLQNIRVLAMGEQVRSDPPSEEGPEPIKAAVATLELTPAQAQTLAVATQVGQVTLALRSLGPEPGQPNTSVSLDGGFEAPIRLHAFGSARDLDIGSGR